MANPIDVVLRLTADTTNAIRNLENVQQTARRTQAEVSRVGQGLQNALIAAQGRGGSAIGAFGGALTAGGNIGEATLAGLGAAFPEVGAGLATVAAVTGLADWLRGTERRETRLEGRLAAPLSAADAAQQIRSLAALRAQRITWDRGGVSRGFRQLTDVLRGDNPLDPQRGTQRELKTLFRDMARTNFPLALQVFAALGSPDDLRAVLDQVRAENTRKTSSSHYLESLKPRTVTGRGSDLTQVTQNIYTGIYAGSGMSQEQIGREVQAVLDRRDRANGSYSSSISRVGT